MLLDNGYSTKVVYEKPIAESRFSLDNRLDNFVM